MIAPYAAQKSFCQRLDQELISQESSECDKQKLSNAEQSAFEIVLSNLTGCGFNNGQAKKMMKNPCANSSIEMRDERKNTICTVMVKCCCVPKFKRNKANKSIVQLYVLDNVEKRSSPFHLSPEIGKLSQLRTLYISSAQIQTEIPDEIQELTQLKELHIIGANVKGTFPQFIPAFQDLERLELSTMDKEQINDETMEGNIPDNIGELSNLKLLALENLRLSGTLPYSFGNLQNLVYMSLVQTNMGGVLPSSLKDLVQIKQLKIENNHFTGKIPRMNICLQHNVKCTFREPFTCDDLTLSLDTFCLDDGIDAEHNSSCYSINKKDCDAWLDFWKYLHIPHNETCFKTPDGKSTTTYLVEQAPPCNGEYPKMAVDLLNTRNQTDQLREVQQEDDISCKYMLDIGCTSNSIVRISVINYDDTERNTANVRLLSNKVSKLNLRDLTLRNLGLRGTVPSTVWNMDTLLNLDLSKNRFSGGITSLSKMQNIERLYLDTNSFTGTIPHGIDELLHLESLTLRENNWTITDVDTQVPVQCLLASIACDKFWDSSTSIQDITEPPTKAPSRSPTTSLPTKNPTSLPTVSPTNNPTYIVKAITDPPTAAITGSPTNEPSFSPTVQPVDWVEENELFFIVMLVVISCSFPWIFYFLYQLVFRALTKRSGARKVQHVNSKTLYRKKSKGVASLHASTGETDEAYVSKGSSSNATLVTHESEQTTPSPTVSEFDNIDISKVELESVIGKGGNGKIYKGKYCGSPVAVKEIFTSLCDSFENKIFLRELNHLKLLRHPHIVALYGASIAPQIDPSKGSNAVLARGKRYFLITELCKCSLRDVLESWNGPVTELYSTKEIKNALRIGIQSARGGAFIHERKVIHFDIKPANLLLDNAGNVKICDLGVARLFSSDQQLTITTMQGTPAYIAPELLRSQNATLSSAVDVYSWSLVLWETLHKRKPHPPTWSIPVLFGKVLQDKYRPIIESQIPESLSQLLKKCWSEDPVLRPSFNEIVVQLELIQEELSLHHTGTEYPPHIPLVDNIELPIQSKLCDPIELKHLEESVSLLNETRFARDLKYSPDMVKRHLVLSGKQIKEADSVSSNETILSSDPPILSSNSLSIECRNWDEKGITAKVSERVSQHLNQESSELQLPGIKPSVSSDGQGNDVAFGKQFSEEENTIVAELQNRIKDYEVDQDNLLFIRPVGRGSNGTVSLGILLSNFQFVAIKSIGLHSQQSRDQFEKEMELLQNNNATMKEMLDSQVPFEKSILEFYGAYLDHESARVNILLEYLNGGSCQELVDQGGCPHEDVLSWIAHDVLVALRCFHINGGIHRDIKPGNILLDTRGFAKLADFGLSWDKGSKKSEVPTANCAETFVGTMLFMSPERLEGQKYTAAADIWSFGFSLLCIALGEHPIKSNGFFDLRDRLQGKCSPSSLLRTSRGNQFSKEFVNFIGKCIDNNPQHRSYASDLLTDPFIIKYANQTRNIPDSLKEKQHETRRIDLVTSVAKRLVVAVKQNEKMHSNMSRSQGDQVELVDLVVGNCCIPLSKLEYLSEQTFLSLDTIKSIFISSVA